MRCDSFSERYLLFSSYSVGRRVILKIEMELLSHRTSEKWNISRRWGGIVDIAVCPLQGTFHSHCVLWDAWGFPCSLVKLNFWMNSMTIKENRCYWCFVKSHIKWKDTINSLVCDFFFQIELNYFNTMNQTLVKKMLLKLTYSLISWRHLLNWNIFFLDDSNLSLEMLASHALGSHKY